MTDKDLEKQLKDIRGDKRRRSPNVRVLAAFAEHTDCGLANLGMAAGVNFDQLLEGTRLAASFGISPFGFSRGKTVEALLAENGHALLLALLRDHMGFDVQDARIENLRDKYGKNQKGLRDRERETDSHLRLIIRNDPEAPNLMDGAVFSMEIGGVLAFFEADAIAARFGGKIHVGEVKSFPIVDDRADPEKVAGALNQAAIYILLVRKAIVRLGGDPSIVSSEAMLIAPKNVGLRPTLKLIDVSRQIKRAEDLLAAVPDAAALVRALPPGITFAPVVAGDGKTEAQRLEALHDIADRVGTAYRPECLKTCGNARFCRERAAAAGSPTLLGQQALRHLPGVQFLERVADLSEGAPATPAERPLAPLIERIGRLYNSAAG